MKIAVFIKSTTLHEHFGGLETQNKVLCEGLVEKGHSVTVYAPKRELKIEKAIENGVHYRFIDSYYKLIPYPFRYKENWFYKSFEVFSKDHEKKPFDIVVSQSSAGVGVIKQKKDLEVKTIAISHGTILGEFKTVLSNSKSVWEFIRSLTNAPFVLANFFGRQRDFVLMSDRVVAVSRAVKDSLIDETFVSENKVEIIYNGVDPSKFYKPDDKKGDSKGSVNLIYVGRIVKSKGLFNLLSVIKDIKDMDFVLHIVGDGEDMKSMMEYSEKEGLTEHRVKFYGKVPYNEVADLLKKADIFVMPTLRVEGFPMTLPEAMFAGLPVVASNIGGVGDAVDDGKTGYLVEAGNNLVLKEKLIKLMDDEDLRKSMGNAGREKAENEFTLEIMINKYEKLLSYISKEEI